MQRRDPSSPMQLGCSSFLELIKNAVKVPSLRNEPPTVFE